MKVVKIIALALLVIAGLAGGYVILRRAKYTNSDSPFENAIEFYAFKYGVDQALIRAIIMQESGYNPNAVNAADPSYGLMQINPNTAGKDYFGYAVKPEVLLDPDINIAVGTWYISKQVNALGFRKGILAYNEGASRARRGVDTNYDNGVIGYYKQYGGIVPAGEDAV